MSYLWRSHTPADKKVERLIPQGFELIVSKNIALGSDRARLMLSSALYL